MSIGLLLGSLAGFILFFVLLLIFAPYLSFLAYGVGFIYGGLTLIFNLFAYAGASCDKIDIVSNLFLSLLCLILFLKIYNHFKGSSGS